MRLIQKYLPTWLVLWHWLQNGLEVTLGMHTDHCDVPRHLAALPRDYSDAIRMLAIPSSEASWFLRGWNAG